MDEQVAQEILRVVQPAAVEAAVRANEAASDRRDAAVNALHHDLEAAHYAARRAQKQYDGTDPENRLVADELERRWNTALERVRDLERRIEDQRSALVEAPAVTLEEFTNLADDLDIVWNDPETDAGLKKRIVRTLIHEVIADIDHEASEVVLIIHWKGGVHTELRVPRRKRGSATRTNPDIIAAVKALARLSTDRTIAGFLNRNGLKTGRGNRWSQQRVTALRTYHKIPNYNPQTKQREGWMNLTEAAAFLGLSSRTIRLATERNDIPGLHPLPDGPWAQYPMQLIRCR